MSERHQHCWQDQGEQIREQHGDAYYWNWVGERDGVGGTCFLPKDHIGPCEFTRDDEWGVTFAGPETTEERE
jgi:hypothetical protein